MMMKFDLIPPFHDMSIAKKHLMLARKCVCVCVCVCVFLVFICVMSLLCACVWYVPKGETLELATYHGIACANIEAFMRNVSQLKTYYFDYA